MSRFQTFPDWIEDNFVKWMTIFMLFFICATFVLTIITAIGRAARSTTIIQADSIEMINDTSYVLHLQNDRIYIIIKKSKKENME